MKTRLIKATIAAVVAAAGISVRGATTIDATHNDAYGANIGWINAQGDVSNGMVVGQAFCSGYMYSGNCGWIHLGDGTPANGTAYANNSATDYGINHDGFGNLTGYAYGANIGWINFEQTYGKPKVDLATGILSGYAYGANVGWISLNTAQGYVKTVSMDAGPDTDGDNIPDAWELGHTNVLTAFSSSGDADGDGVSDRNEYLADTDPSDPSDLLLITDLSVNGTTNILTWTAKPTRSYMLQRSQTLTNWVDGAFTIPSGGPEMSETVTGVTNATRFYRVKAVPPLTP
ncbi:MAG: hypothetical protein MUC65_04300 [Pontiellaceae bacterium]|jgi:hypothetical protein|nr:hypothetical protein [Pontiellaceae bacterium]